MNESGNNFFSLHLNIICSSACTYLVAAFAITGILHEILRATFCATPVFAALRRAHTTLTQHVEALMVETEGLSLELGAFETSIW